MHAIERAEYIHRDREAFEGDGISREAGITDSAREEAEIPERSR